jgi:hypothetical protein
MKTQEGANSLRRFIEDAKFNCTLATELAVPVREFQEENDSIWLTLQSGAVHPNDALIPVFCMRSHGSFRAAILTVWSGMVVDVYPLLRSCLENALYCLEATASGKSKVWIDRGKTPDATKACKKAFRISDIWNTLGQRDGDLRDRCNILYNNLIDFGGHPNALGILSTMTDFNDKKVEIADLMPGTIPWKVARQYVARTGILSLRVFQVTHPRIFEKTGVSERTQELYLSFGNVKGIHN